MGSVFYLKYPLVYWPIDGAVEICWLLLHLLKVYVFLSGLFLNHSVCLLLVFFLAIGNAFVSGTEESLIYDNLKSKNREDQFSRIYGRSRFFANIGNLTGIVISGVLVTFISFAEISLLSACICLINALLASKLEEKNYYANQLNDSTIAIHRTFKDAAQLFRDNSLSLLTVLFLILFSNLVSYLDEFDALIIRDSKVDYYWVSVLLTVRFIFVALGDLIKSADQFDGYLFYMALQALS